RGRFTAGTCRASSPSSVVCSSAAPTALSKRYSSPASPRSAKLRTRRITYGPPRSSGTSHHPVDRSRHLRRLAPAPARKGNRSGLEELRGVHQGRAGASDPRQDAPAARLNPSVFKRKGQVSTWHFARQSEFARLLRANSLSLGDVGGNREAVLIARQPDVQETHLVAKRVAMDPERRRRAAQISGRSFDRAHDVLLLE